MKKLTVYQIDSFTKTRFKGNPAGVVMNADSLNEEEMLQIARELNNSETAFLFAPDSQDCDGMIRYFTPKTEVPTCGHATIAALYAKALEENLDSCILKMKTKIGVLPLEIIRENNDYLMIMTQGKIEFHEPFEPGITHRILHALGLNKEHLLSACPIQIVSTGHGKVMVGIKHQETLNQLTPNFQELIQISQQIRCTGYFVFALDCLEPDILACGRMFAPAIGINEDPVTGNANGPLGAYLIHHHIIRTQPDGVYEFRAKQGEAMLRPGIIAVKVFIENNQPVLVQIKGQAVVVFKTEIG